jgi:hypothetical protein
MLRDIAGDATLSAALRAYNPQQDLENTTNRSSFERLLEQAGMRHDLSWFFEDWVDADKGLPDLTIDSVFRGPAEAGNWLVAVNVNNAGYASAEVPVTVRTGAASVTQRLLVPARGKATQRIVLLDKPDEAQVNDGTVPETQATVHVTTLNDAGAGQPLTRQPTAPQQ